MSADESNPSRQPPYLLPKSFLGRQYLLLSHPYAFSSNNQSVPSCTVPLASLGRRHHHSSSAASAFDRSAVFDNPVTLHIPSFTKNDQTPSLFSISFEGLKAESASLVAAHKRFLISPWASNLAISQPCSAHCPSTASRNRDALLPLPGPSSSASWLERPLVCSSIYQSHTRIQFFL